MCPTLVGDGETYMRVDCLDRRVKEAIWWWVFPLLKLLVKV